MCNIWHTLLKIGTLVCVTTGITFQICNIMLFFLLELYACFFVIDRRLIEARSNLYDINWAIKPWVVNQIRYID